MRGSGKGYHFYKGCNKHNLAGASGRGLWNGMVANSIKSEGERKGD